MTSLWSFLLLSRPFLCFTPKSTQDPGQVSPTSRGRGQPRASSAGGRNVECVPTSAWGSPRAPDLATGLSSPSPAARGVQVTPSGCTAQPGFEASFYISFTNQGDISKNSWRLEKQDRASDGRFSDSQGWAPAPTSPALVYQHERGERGRGGALLVVFDSTS